MNSIEEILALCIREIKAGQASLEECLERYPALRRELEPLLKIALSIREAAPVKPSDDFRIKTRAQLMESIRSESAMKPAKASFRFRWPAGAMRFAAIAVATVMVVSVAGTGSVYASQRSLPGEALYTVKTGTEQVRRAVTLDDDARLELELNFAGTRLDEIEALAYKNPDMIPAAVKGYENNIMQAAEDAGKDASTESLETVALATAQHLAALDEIQDSTGLAEKTALQTATQLALATQQQAITGIAETDPLRATEMNLVNMQNRLARAIALADRGEADGAEETLNQFLEMYSLGEVISEKARNTGQDTAGISALVAQARTAQQEAVDRMTDKVDEASIAPVRQALGIDKKNQEKPEPQKPQETPAAEAPGKSGEAPGQVTDETGDTTGGSDNSNAGGSDNSNAGGSDNSNAGGSDNSNAGGSDNSNAGGSDNSNAGGNDNSSAGGNDNSNAGGSGNSNASGNDNSSAGGNDNSSAGGNDNSNAGGSGNSNAGGNDNFSAGGNDNSNAGGNDNSSAGGNDNSNAGGSGNSNAGGNDNSSAGGNDNSNAGGSDNSNAGGNSGKSDK